MIFRIAILQMHSVSTEKNTEIVLSKMKEEKEQKADIVLLPECFLSGYQFPIEKDRVLTAADSCIIKLNDGEYFSEGFAYSELLKKQVFYPFIRKKQLELIEDEIGQER